MGLDCPDVWSSTLGAILAHGTVCARNGRAGRDGLAVIAYIHKTSLQEMEVDIVMYNGIL